MLKLFRLLAPYRAYIAIVLVLALAQSLGFLLLPRLMSDIVDKGIVKGDQRAILRIGGLMLLMSSAATFWQRSHGAGRPRTPRSSALPGPD